MDMLFVRHRTPAYRVAMRLLGNEADALDAVQEGFVKALVNLDGFQGRSSFKTWLMRVVSNAALDLGRKRGRRSGKPLDAEDDADPDPGLMTWDDPARGPIWTANTPTVVPAAPMAKPLIDGAIEILVSDSGSSSMNFVVKSAPPEPIRAPRSTRSETPTRADTAPEG